MTSLHYITSTDPTNYGCVKYSMTPTVSQPCQVRISSIQYTANFSITTEDDWVELKKEDGTTTKYNFAECGAYYIDTVANVISEITSGELAATLTDRGLLKYTSASYDYINDATHRAKLLMGLYHCDLPLEIGTGIYSPSLPLVCYGNILFLESNLPSPVGVRSNDKNKEEYKSIVYKGSDFIYPGIPVNSRTPGPVIITKTDNLTDLEFKLVDFMMEPIILHSPLTITMEVFYGIQPMPMLPVS